MDPSNVKEAIKEAQTDEQEGADIIMVKPGLPYLDVVRAVKEAVKLPVSVYNVSGEYSMIKAAAERGWLDGKEAMRDAVIGFKVSGADINARYFGNASAEIVK